MIKVQGHTTGTVSDSIVLDWMTVESLYIFRRKDAKGRPIGLRNMQIVVSDLCLGDINAKVVLTVWTVKPSARDLVYA
jgi:hypothetical protein